MAKEPSLTVAGYAAGRDWNRVNQATSMCVGGKAIHPPQENNIRRFVQGAGSPARLLDTRNQAAESQVPEADPADAEFAVKATRSPAQAAAVSMLNRKLARGFRFDLLGLGRHKLLFFNPQKSSVFDPPDSLLLLVSYRLEPSRPLVCSSRPARTRPSWSFPLGLRLAERQAELV